MPFPIAERTEAAAIAPALEALYAAHGTRIHRFLRDLLGDATLAKDATQETFVRAYRKLGTFESGANVVPWLFGIARNVSLELRKARARTGKWMVSDPDADAACESSPERDLLGREALRVVGAALSQLPEERRAMLLLRLDHGLSYDDIAVTMGCSLAKVKVEIFRAREVLRDVMATYQGGER
ncbi:MAG: sigma-70 family RNA polymerase sigma factor [Labilithrix sp.]|nr:sigma-70 family RNA polymerase sigma factor [Labilithrix sp.]